MTDLHWKNPLVYPLALFGAAYGLSFAHQTASIVVAGVAAVALAAVALIAARKDDE